MMLSAVLQEAPTTISCMLDGFREGHQIGNRCSAAVYFTAAARQQVMHLTTVKCFCLGGYRHEFNTEANSCSSN
jgi:hypothetical protein